VVEIQVGLSENSMETQMALFEIVNVLLQEFKGCCTYIDHDFLTMEMVISKPFDAIVKSQLDPVWNHLGSKPKQLISDIKTLRLLLYYLTQYDCITFYKMLNCLRSHEKELGRSSGWIFLNAADQLFTKARHRVYGTDLKGTKIDLNNRHMYSKENRGFKLVYLSFKFNFIYYLFIFLKQKWPQEVNIFYLFESCKNKLI